MLVLADQEDFAREILPTVSNWSKCHLAALEPRVQSLVSGLGPDSTWQCAEVHGCDFAYCILVARSPRSQFDVLRELASANRLPTGNTLCVAGSGHDFHGHHGRKWTAVAGNLHVSVAFTPGQEIDHFGAVFMALPAIATAQTIETVVPAAKPAGIKWVNDVIVCGAKVAGVIAHTRSSDTRVDQAVLGIGINVETTPNIERSRFVPRAGALRELDPTVTQDKVLAALVENLHKQYRAVLELGSGPTVAAYRNRSVVVGRHVEIHPDATESGELVSGRVAFIGDDLELILEGRSAPITRGRLLMTPDDDLGQNP